MSLEPFRRLHVELSLWYAGVFGLLLVVLGLVTYGHMASALLQGADDLNQRAIGDLAESVSTRGARISVEPAHFAEEASEVQGLFDVVSAQVFDADGRLIARSPTGDGQLPLEGAAHESIRWGPTELRLLRHPIVADGRRLGTIVVGQDMRVRLEALSGLSRDLWLLIPVGGLLTLVAGTLLAGKALRPIKDAMARQRQFIADASHELRTPVAIVLAQAEAGLQGDDKEARAALDVIRRTAERMGRLVAGLLLLTRAGEARLRLDCCRFFLEDLAEEIVADLRPLADGQDVTLRFECRADDVAVHGDPEQLRQLVVNLVDNALGNTPSQGEVVVWVDRQRTGVAMLGVRDTGVGIARDEQDRVFDRFYRGAASTRPGSGLGLSIARAIAVAHGGHLRVASEPGKGAEFVLLLPSALPDSEAP